MIIWQTSISLLYNGVDLYLQLNRRGILVLYQKNIHSMTLHLFLLRNKKLRMPMSYSSTGASVECMCNLSLKKRRRKEKKFRRNYIYFYDYVVLRNIKFYELLCSLLIKKKCYALYSFCLIVAQTHTKFLFLNLVSWI